MVPGGVAQRRHERPAEQVADEGMHRAVGSGRRVTHEIGLAARPGRGRVDVRDRQLPDLPGHVRAQALCCDPVPAALADRVLDRRRPMNMAFFPPVWLLLGWCEVRRDFRAFRIDRIARIEYLPEHYPQEPGRRLVDYLATIR